MANRRARKRQHRQERPPCKVVEAQQVVLKDMAGNVRAQLGCAPDGNPQLRLMSADGKPQIVAGLCSGVPGLWVFDGEGRPRVELSVAEEGGHVGLHVSDGAGVIRLVLNHGDLGGTQLQLHDAEGRERVFVGCGPCGTSVAKLCDAQGGTSAGLHASDGLPGLIALADAAGKSSAGLYLAEDGTLVVGRDEADGAADAQDGTTSHPHADSTTEERHGTQSGGPTPSQN
jgi:hypothetical protein